MGLPSNFEAEVKRRLAGIHGLFRSEMKVLLLIDSGDAETSLMIGNADSETAIQRIRELEAIAAPDGPDPSARPAPLAREGSHG
ncbi:hypothetical protein [Methylorubrum sp. SB2]|uniref:hypothetical protein n=1 Tax=Methylorubrum subtropicum TaxID=3138812 RepID=UPI00313AA4E4